MTRGTYESYMIAAGHNVAQMSLTNIELITPTSDEPFNGPKALALYNDGQTKKRLNGQIFSAGYASVRWMFTRLTYAQYAYMRSTFCSGGLSGNVTIYTTLNTATYVRMNAVLEVKTPNELNAEFWYKDAYFEFTELLAAA